MPMTLRWLKLRSDVDRALSVDRVGDRGAVAETVQVTLSPLQKWNVSFTGVGEPTALALSTTPAAGADKIFQNGLFIEMPFDAHCGLALRRTSKRFDYRSGEVGALSTLV